MNPGNLLIAEPSIFGDQNFHRSIIMVVDHKKTGSFGFIINRPLNYSITDVTDKIKYDFPLYCGGPVEQDNLFFVHRAGHLIPNSVSIEKDLYWGGNFEKIISLINERKLTTKEIRFFLGYSGWSSKQLCDEIKSKSWILIENPYSSKIISKTSNSLWKEQMMALGGDYLIWSNSPENPYEN